MAAWCGIAYRIETYRDHHGTDGAASAKDVATRILGPRPATRRGREKWDQVVSLVSAASHIIEHAHGREFGLDESEPDDPRVWKCAIERSIEASAAARHQRGVGIDIDLEGVGRSAA